MYKIMLADDEGIVIDSLTYIIRQNFGGACQVESAKTGRSVIELAESFRPDIAFMDIQMPVMDGWQTSAAIRKLSDPVLSHIPIICMPSLGMLTINALAAADSVVIPTQPHYLSAKGLELLLRSVSKVKRQINPHLRIDGILMTMVMPRTNISKEITATVKSAYGQRIKVFDAQIPHSIRAVEATAEGKSIFAYDKGGKVAAAYEQFGKEVAEIGEKQKNRNRADRIR